jgi:hypothetical protein
VTMVAVCTDASPPTEASAFSSCTAVAWTDAANVAPGLFDGFTMADALAVAGPVMVLWSIAFSVRVLSSMIVRRAS